MFTIVMMILSSLVTLYFARSDFRKRVNDFIDWKDTNDPTLDTPTDEADAVSKDYVSAWSSNERRAEGPAKDWMEWTDEDEQNLPQPSQKK